MPLGFGNAVVLQTLFSMFIILWFEDYNDSNCTNSCVGFPSSRVTDASRNWVRTITARIGQVVFS